MKYLPCIVLLHTIVSISALNLNLTELAEQTQQNAADGQTGGLALVFNLNAMENLLNSAMNTAHSDLKNKTYAPKKPYIHKKDKLEVEIDSVTFNNFTLDDKIKPHA